MVGTAIAVAVSNPYIAVPLAFASHFLGDLVPHWDFFSNTTSEEKTKGWRVLGVMADLTIGVGLGAMFTFFALWKLQNTPLALNIFLCGIASVLPDVLIGPYVYRTNGVNFLSYWAHKIQSKMQFPAPLPWGIVSQIIVSLASFAVIANLVL